MKSLIFDFDGTLADSLPVVIGIAEEVLGVSIDSDEVKMYRNMTIKQILKEAKIPIYKVPGLLVKGRPLLQKKIHEVELFEGLKEVIKELSNNNNLYVVSSNSTGIITKFLVDAQLRGYFKNVYGNVGIFSKSQALKKVAKKESFDINNAIYIGDEVRDIEASKKVGMPIISVSWGFNGREILQKYQPEFIADKPKDILKYVKI